MATNAMERELQFAGMGAGLSAYCSRRSLYRRSLCASVQKRGSAHAFLRRTRSLLSPHLAADSWALLSEPNCLLRWNKIEVLRVRGCEGSQKVVKRPRRAPGP